MTGRPELESSIDLQQRLNLLADAATLLERHGVDLSDVGVTDLVERASARLRHGTDHTLVALVGSTGSGKSSTLNAVAGQQVARAGVTRPTTSVTQAVTFGDPADGLLDLVGVTRRHHLHDSDPALRGLVLLDLPDFDSVTVAHRMEVDRLIQLVDLMMWVTDPQKYADEALHVGYLQPLASHAEVIQVVLNKADTLDPAALASCLADLGRLLAADGLPGVSPMAMSTLSGEGMDQVAGVLAAEVNAKQAAVERIRADIDSTVAAVRAATGQVEGLDVEALRDNVVDGLANAAGVDGVAALVAQQYRRDAGLATGWPPLRFLTRFRRSPLTKLSTTADNHVAQAEVSRTLRKAGQAAQEKMGGGWSDAATTSIRGQVDPVTEALDRRISRNVQVLRKPPRWWGPVTTAHRLWLGAAVIGAVWLIGLALVQTFLLVDVTRFVPRWRGIALPTALLVGGVGLGLLTALVSRLMAGIGGSRQAGRAADHLRIGVAEVAEEHVIDPLRTLLADAELTADLLARAGGGTIALPATTSGGKHR